jgi:hypothetical protein
MNDEPEMSAESTDKDSNKYSKISARPGANGKSIRIINPVSGKIMGYCLIHNSTKNTRYTLDIKKAYNRHYTDRLRNEYEIFDLSLAKLTRKLREIGRYAVRCSRISDPIDVVRKEHRENAAILRHIVKFYAELRGWARDDMAGVMASAVETAKGIPQADVQLGRGDAYYQELLRLLNVAEDGLKQLQVPSTIWTDRLKTIIQIKRLFRRQSEKIASLMADLPSPPSSSPGHPAEAYHQLLRIVEALKAHMTLVIRLGQSHASGGPRRDWGLEALTRQTFEFWEMLEREVTVDHNRNATSKIVWFIRALAEPIQITSDPRKISSAIRAERASRRKKQEQSRNFM